jgi:hypothetical protein
MAIGTRILSNNLSGKTANVTFLPTTGGTIDLGSQTIPFNNITTYPYGTYEIYVPEYDYTYELVINPPATNVESFVFISKMTNNNNYGVANLNFNDFTAEILDLGIDVTGWYLDQLYPMTNSGYMYFFYNRNNCNLNWVIFTDSAGNIIENYQTDSNCDYSYYNLAGKWVYYIDYHNSILKYSNGQDVYTLTGDSSYQYIDVYNGWDGVMSNDNFLISITDTTGNTLSNYIVNNENLIQFGDTLDTNTYNTYVSSYYSGDFIFTFKHNHTNNTLESVDIYGSDGSNLQNVQLTGSTYNNNNLSFYGDNKIVCVLSSNSDINVEYLIIHYDGNTNVLNTTTHERGSNYINHNIYSRTKLYPNNGGCESYLIEFFNVYSYTSIGYLVTYYDTIYMLSGDTDFRTYTFQDSGLPDKIIMYYLQSSNSLNTICVNGDDVVSTLSYVESGATFHSTNIPMSGSPNILSWDIVGNGTVTLISTDFSNTGGTLVHIVENGDLGGIVENIEFPGTYQYNFISVGNTFQFLNYSGTSYHIDEASDLFQSGGGITGDTINTNYPSPQFKSDFLSVGPISTFNYTTGEINLLFSTGYTNTVTLPITGETEVTMGSDKFMITYIDESGFTNINLYDFSFNLLNSVVTEHTTGWWSTMCSGDRFITIINDNSKYIIYLVSESVITSVVLTDYNNDSAVNDYINWND